MLKRILKKIGTMGLAILMLWMMIPVASAEQLKLTDFTRQEEIVMIDGIPYTFFVETHEYSTRSAGAKNRTITAGISRTAGSMPNSGQIVVYQVTTSFTHNYDSTSRQVTITNQSTKVDVKRESGFSYQASVLEGRGYKDVKLQILGNAEYSKTLRCKSNGDAEYV